MMREEAMKLDLLTAFGAGIIMVMRSADKAKTANIPRMEQNSGARNDETLAARLKQQQILREAGRESLASPCLCNPKVGTLTSFLDTIRLRVLRPSPHWLPCLGR